MVYANTSGGVEFSGAQQFAAAVNNTIYQPAGTAISIHGSSQDVALTNNLVWAIDGYGVTVEAFPAYCETVRTTETAMADARNPAPYLPFQTAETPFSLPSR